MVTTVALMMAPYPATTTDTTTIDPALSEAAQLFFPLVRGPILGVRVATFAAAWQVGGRFHAARDGCCVVVPSKVPPSICYG